MICPPMLPASQIPLAHRASIIALRTSASRAPSCVQPATPVAACPENLSAATPEAGRILPTGDEHEAAPDGALRRALACDMILGDDSPCRPTSAYPALFATYTGA